MKIDDNNLPGTPIIALLFIAIFIILLYFPTFSPIALSL